MNKLAASALLLLTAYTVSSIAAGPLTAGWWAGPAPAPAGRNGGPSGANNPNEPAPNRTLGRANQPAGGRRVAPVAQPSVQFDGNDSATLEKASNSGKPIVVLFPKEGTDISTYFVGQDFVDMKDVDAVFVAVPYTADRTPAPGAKETIVPYNKLLGDNPARDVGHPVGQEAVYLFDCYGNYNTDIGMKFTSKPTSKQLKEALQRMPGRIEAATKKLQKNLDSANALLAKGDRNGAFKAAVKVLEANLAGYAPSSEAAQIYNKICDEVMGEIAELKSGDDAKAAQKKLGELSGVFTKKAAPSVAAEIADAKKALK